MRVSVGWVMETTVTPSTAEAATGPAATCHRERPLIVEEQAPSEGQPVRGMLSSVIWSNGEPHKVPMESDGSCHLDRTCHDTRGNDVLSGGEGCLDGNGRGNDNDADLVSQHLECSNEAELPNAVHGLVS